MKPDRALIAEEYRRGAGGEAPLPVSGIQDDYYRAKLESGLITRSAGYTADWTVEDDEYSIAPQTFGGQYTATYIENADTERSADDEDLSDCPDLEPTHEDDLRYDPVSEVEEFVQDVSAIAGLTRRERQIVEWIAEGNSLVGEYSLRLADSLGITPLAARKYKERAVNKLREHWANDMDAQGLVDPRYLEPIGPNEFVCTKCHLIYNKSQRTDSGGCTECAT